MMIDESLMIRVDDNDVDVSVDKRMHDIMEMKAMVLMLMTIMDYTHSTCIPSQTLVGGDDDENRTGVSDDEVNQIGKDDMIAVNQNKKQSPPTSLRPSSGPISRPTAFKLVCSKVELGSVQCTFV